MPAARFQVRPARDDDRLPLALLFAAVAKERDGIASEPPIDVEECAANWKLDATFLAVADGEVIGSLHVDHTRFGFGEIGMMVARDWRGRGVGGALLGAAIEIAEASLLAQKWRCPRQPWPGYQPRSRWRQTRSVV